MAIEVQNMKTVLAVAPVSLDDATATAIEVDAQGFGNARFLFSVGATAGNISVCKIQSATSSGGSFSDISGASIAADVIDADADNTVHAIEVDLTDKSIGEFLQVVLTEDNTGAALIGCTCILSRAADCPTSASERGLTNETLA